MLRLLTVDPSDERRLPAAVEAERLSKMLRNNSELRRTRRNSLTTAFERPAPAAVRMRQCGCDDTEDVVLNRSANDGGGGGDGRLELAGIFFAYSPNTCEESGGGGPPLGGGVVMMIPAFNSSEADRCRPMCLSVRQFS